MKTCESVLSTIALMGLLATAPAAQAAPKEDKGPIVHIIQGALNAGTVDSATILGPLPIDTTMEISTITTVNLSDEEVLIQYRFVVPHPTATTIDGCHPESDGGTADYVVVFDELMRVMVPPKDTVHVTFPESLDIPGQYANSAGVIVEPDPTEGETWCLNVFFATSAGAPSAGVKADARVSGRIMTPIEE